MAQVTLIVTQRERFSYTQPSLESIYQNTHFPFDLIYVDGNSPPHIQEYLEIQAQEKGFTLVRRETYLAPNQARNLVLNQVKTPYVVFIDNDVLVTPSWLGKLIDCAEETGAWAVIPLFLEGNPQDEVIHMAGGLAHFCTKNGKKRFFEKLYHCQRKLNSLKKPLKRDITELIELHSCLFKTELFETIGLLDEKFMSASEHLDLALTIRQLGKCSYIEPEAKVSYLISSSFESWDLPFFYLRWSDQWNQQSLNHFRTKWELMDNDPYIKQHHRWLTYHRQLATENSLYKKFGIKYESWLNRMVLSPLESQMNLK